MVGDILNIYLKPGWLVDWFLNNGNIQGSCNTKQEQLLSLVVKLINDKGNNPTLRENKDKCAENIKCGRIKKKKKDREKIVNVCI